jgi:hypothetical protein
MTERELLRENAALLRSIVRSIDKNLEYSFVDQIHEGKISLRLSSRGREGIVSLLTEDLQRAGGDAVRKNSIRQKIKGTRDRLLSNHVADVMGRREARLLKQSGGSEDESRGSFFFRRPPRRGR